MNQHNTRDYHSKPFQVMVVMGESTVEGGGWVRNSTERFADILAELINVCQETLQQRDRCKFNLTPQSGL